jgi:hypothetical protein
MSLGCLLIFLGLIVDIPKPLNVMRQIVVLPLGIYGFSFIMVGEKKKKGIHTNSTDELTERIVKNLRKRPEEKTRLYS